MALSQSVSLVLLQVLERALRCCTLGVAASTNDGYWVAFAGEAIDVMAFGIARYVFPHQACQFEID